LLRVLSDCYKRQYLAVVNTLVSGMAKHADMRLHVSVPGGLLTSAISLTLFNTLTQWHIHAYGNLVTTLNFPSSVRCPISAHREMGEVKERERERKQTSASRRMVTNRKPRSGRIHLWAPQAGSSVTGVAALSSPVAQGKAVLFSSWGGNLSRFVLNTAEFI
jgi:hypothetical protein